MSHTPGPWMLRHDAYIVPAAHADRPIGAAADPVDDRARYAHVICTLALRYGLNLDDARLIAAAPELLAEMKSALEREHDPLDEPENQSAAWHRMRALIAKAEAA